MFNWLISGLLVLTGWLALGWMIRAAKPQAERRALRVVLLVSYALRVVLAVGLYVVSRWELPVFRTLQLGNGFWVFSHDAWTVHLKAMSLVKAWTLGTAWPNPELGIEYTLLVALWYAGAGGSPLPPILLNCWFGAGIGVLAYLIGRRLFTPRAGLLSAILVSWWPSSFLWSAQLIKDPLSWFLIFVALWLVLGCLEPEERTAQGFRVLRLGRWAAFGLCAFLLTRARDYLGPVLVLCAVGVVGPAALWDLARRRTGTAWRRIALAGMVVCAVWLGRAIDMHGSIASMNARRPAVDETVVSPLVRAIASHRFLTTVQAERLQTVFAARLEEAPWPSAKGTWRAIGEEIGETIGLLGEARALFATTCYYQAPVLLATAGRLSHAPPRISHVVAALQHLVGLTEAQAATLETALTQRSTRGPWPSRPTEWRVLGETLGPALGLEGQQLVEFQTALPFQAPLLALVPRPVSGVPNLPTAARGGSGESRAGARTGSPIARLARLVSTGAESIGRWRQGYMVRGHVVMDEEVRIAGARDVLRYLPRALTIGLFAPFPSQWFDAGGVRGGLRALSAPEMLWWYLLLPAVVLGCGRVVRHGGTGGWFILAFIALTLLPLSLVIANLGTLFRLRLQCVLPLLIMAGGGVRMAIDRWSLSRARVLME